MIKQFVPFLLVFSFLAVTGQEVPRYVLVEHFTNTWCPICAGRNPSLFNVIQKYPKSVHHLSLHPPIPYSGCPLYQFNKSDNQERTNYYGVIGTPVVVLNGGGLMGGSPLVTEDQVKKEIAKTSPLAVLVSENGQGNNRTVTVKLKSSTSLSGDLRLMVILAERNLRFTASNGELDHYNVMRKFLTPVSGQKITISQAGEQNFVFNYKDTLGWKPEEIYALALVQNSATKEVLNSGTRFDQVTTPLESFGRITGIKIYPTLVSQAFFIDYFFSTAGNLEIFNTRGQLVIKNQQVSGRNPSIPVDGLNPGVYLIKLVAGDKIFNARFIKQ